MVIKKGSLPMVAVNVEKRQGNKKVTRIVGVESFLVSVYITRRCCCCCCCCCCRDEHMTKNLQVPALHRVRLQQQRPLLLDRPWEQHQHTGTTVDITALTASPF